MSYPFTTRVNGIPCICDVQVYFREEGTKQEVFQFHIKDRKGYKAPWLEKYLKPDDAERLMEEYQYEVLAEQAGHSSWDQECRESWVLK